MADQGADDLEAGVRAGDLLAGKYRVEKILGVGGMGVVVAAHHVDLDSRVAIKFLRPALLSNQEAVERFAREARAAVKINSEYVARVTDVGTLESGSPYMVIEYLEGGDLAGWLKLWGPLPIDQAVDFVLQTCIAVADAHVLGIVHRDLKPANLFCVRRSDGQLSIKVLDFGISKVTDVDPSSGGMSMTTTSAMMGSPFYMSPEQMRSSRNVDARADIWALGIVLCELITGTMAFTAESVTDLAIKVANEQPPRLRSARSNIPPGLEAVIFKCLEKDRTRRYRNVAELAVALLPYGSSQARASVDRVTGIIGVAHRSASGLPMPSSVPPVVREQHESLRVHGSVPPWSRTHGVAPGKKAVMGAGFAAVSIAVGVAVLHGASSGQAAAPGPTAVALSGSGAPLPSAAPAPTQAAQALGVAPALAVAATAAGEPAPSTSRPVAATPTPAPPAHARAAPAKHDSASPSAHSSRSSASARDCDPPFTLDEQGQKRFKPECFLPQ